MMFGNPSNTLPDVNWLKSRFHFSFAEHHNSKQNKFGVLRVCNDDLVQPRRGFGAHPHSNMEIVTFVVDGLLTHKDNMGTQETLRRGAIQFMTAGTGVRHSEYNASETEPLRFIQMWITPRNANLDPNYGSYSPPADFYSLPKWHHLVSDVLSTTSNPVKINQDANIFVCELQPNETNTFTVEAERQGYLLCIEGTAKFTEMKDGKMSENFVELEQYCAAEIKGPFSMNVEAQSKILLLLVEMKKTNDTRF
jgi:redox-sensitive bicupin YhaK (pirin superfamily)